ncbi:fungal specific transcription factor domain-containing protein [Trichoderma breve]|uniref:Fungal specific transcription factor domain-containing protein n=1 Tax=Trichoderma breve TaxID=2034170 RepID=A0A9W9E7S3_9HYPO|nr:fungal specific transcription factor domain-containing protein [Trichoderma breve]KAJ4859687.1 fungal specific transcription factor domain-containing protein [Trichoderma breve]
MENPKDMRNRLRTKDRTRIACRRCNSKKVKCDAAPGVPCSGCQIAKAECILIDSKRGRYVRRKNIPPSEEQTRGETPASVSPPKDQSPASHKDHSNNHAAPIVEGVSSVEPADGQLLRGLSQSFERRAPTDSSALFYLHIADQSVRPTQQPINDSIRTFYAGDSFSLTYAIHDVLAPFLSHRLNYQKRLHFPIAEGFDPSDMGRENIANVQVTLLRERNILHRLGPDALEKLLDVYFRWFHPAFPLLNRQDFLQKCLRNQMSLLVLNALLLVAATICDQADIALTGCKSRQHARTVFYTQAKALYDADLDPDKENNVAAVFLMSFWWGGSNDEKDSWHWLGIAVSLAQSLGMHRSTAKSHMSSEKSRLWRRIWWCIRIRDTLTSGSIGRPQHIAHRDCDVEMLEPGDMANENLLGAEEAIYACQMARLSIIFSRIIASRYAAVQSTSPTQKTQLEDDLENFRQQVPAELQYKGVHAETGQGLWSAMLLMAYNFGVILLCRPTSTGDETASNFWGDRPKAMAAANEVTRVMEDILSTSLVRLCQIHTIPALFNSLSMHVFSLCTSGAIGRELAENRARTCMLGLTCLQESWPVSGWILKLFVDIIERLRRKLTNRNKSGELSMVTASPALGPSQQQKNNTNPYNQHLGSMEDMGRQPNARELDITSTMDSTSRPPLETLGDIPFLSNDYSAFSNTNAEMLPNLFVLDDLFSDLDSGQVNFFDLLEVPNYDTIDGISY